MTFLIIFQLLVIYNGKVSSVFFTSSPRLFKDRSLLRGSLYLEDLWVDLQSYSHIAELYNVSQEFWSFPLTIVD